MMNASDRKPVEAEETEGNATGRNQAYGNSDMVGSTDCRDSQKSGRCAGYLRDDVTKVTLF